jgi:hypothetical protein
LSLAALLAFVSQEDTHTDTELRTKRPNRTRRLSDAGLERVLQDRLGISVAVGSRTAVAVIGWRGGRRSRHRVLLVVVVVVLVAAVAVSIAARRGPRLRVARDRHLASGRRRPDRPLAVVVGETGRRPIQRLLRGTLVRGVGVSGEAALLLLEQTGHRVRVLHRLAVLGARRAARTAAPLDAPRRHRLGARPRGGAVLVVFVVVERGARLLADGATHRETVRRGGARPLLAVLDRVDRRRTALFTHQLSCN